MYVYGIEEYNANEYESMYCDKVIIFDLLRSTVYLTINGDKFSVESLAKCEEFANEKIKKDEDYLVEREKRFIEYWVSIHKEELLSNISIEKIIKYYSKKPETKLILRKNKTAVTGIYYARETLMAEYKEKKDRIMKYINLNYSPYERENVLNMYGIDNGPKGDDSIRFYVIGENKNGKKVSTHIDFNLNDTHIVEICCDDVETECIEELRYFCNRYFQLLRKHTLVKDILSLDMGESINYTNLGFVKKKKTF